MSRKRINRSHATRQSKQVNPTTAQSPMVEEVVEETAVEEVLPGDDTATSVSEEEFFAHKEKELLAEEPPAQEEVSGGATAASFGSEDETLSSEEMPAEAVTGETVNEVPEDLATPEEVAEAEATESLDEEVLVEDEGEDRLPPTEFEEDDEEYLSSDKVIHQEKNLAIVQQMDNVVSWELVNLYKENGKVMNKYVLRGSPPVFKVSSTNGSVAEFMVTKELASTLEEVFGDVRKAYHGIDPTIKKNTFGQKTFKEKANSAVEWAQDNPVKALVAAFLVLFFLISPFLY